MADIATVWLTDRADWQVAGPSLLADDGLQTAVLISLFTDRLAELDDALPEGAAGRRGWWGDAYAATAGDRIGSRLWLLARSKQLPQVLRQAEGYASQALQWLVDDGVASAVDVSAERVRDGVLGLLVTVTRNAAPVQRFRFEAFWKGA